MKTAARTRVKRPSIVDALRESEARFRTLAECAPVVVWMTDAQYRCTYISKYWTAFTGRDPEADLGFGWVEALHPEDRERAARDLMDAGASGQACRGEYRVKGANGEYGWLYDYGVPHFHADGSYAGHIGTCTDITQHKTQQRAGLDVQNSLVFGQEAERKRVAQELHDDIIQRLALVGLSMREVEQLDAVPSTAVEERLRTLRQSIESIALDIHRISHNLHPTTLVHLGLVSALRELCREFSEQARVKVEFACDASAHPVSQEIAIALYRITQECLTNVARHSRVHDAVVTYSESADALHLTIADRGIGFDTESGNATAGLGLVSIRERARMIGAEIGITSAVKKGTTIEVRVALRLTSD